MQAATNFIRKSRGFLMMWLPPHDPADLEAVPADDEKQLAAYTTNDRVEWRYSPWLDDVGAAVDGHENSWYDSLDTPIYSWPCPADAVAKPTCSFDKRGAIRRQVSAWKCRACGQLLSFQKLSIIVVTPIPMFVLNAYSIQHTSAERLLELESSLHRTLKFFAPLIDPGGITFFLAGIAVMFLLGLLWRYRQAAHGSWLLLVAASIVSLLSGVAAGLGPLIVALCVLPWSLYIVLLCTDGSHVRAGSEPEVQRCHVC